jgi:transcriptional regulator with XRE-family HTH domain
VTGDIKRDALSMENKRLPVNTFGKHMSTLGERLREERERLGLNQTALGEMGRVSKVSQINYETGKRSPAGDYLAAVAVVGVDVLYVVTGVRTPTGPAALDADTQGMVDLYQRLPVEDRVAMKRLANSAAEHAGEPKKRARGGE